MFGLDHRFTEAEWQLEVLWMGWAQRKADVKLQGNLRGEVESGGLWKDYTRVTVSIKYYSEGVKVRVMW